MKKSLLCDTCVIIDYINERDLVLPKLTDAQFSLFINSTIEMELLYGAHDSRELKKIQQKLNLFRRLEMTQDIMNDAKDRVTRYALSHRLHPADAVIAATASAYTLPLFTYNTKDFKYLSDVRLWDKSNVQSPT